MGALTRCLSPNLAPPRRCEVIGAVTPAGKIDMRRSGTDWKRRRPAARVSAILVGACRTSGVSNRELGNRISIRKPPRSKRI